MRLFRVIWKECMVHLKQEVDEEWENRNRTERNKQAISLKTSQKCEELLKILELYDKEKCLKFREEFERIRGENRESSVELEDGEVFVCEEHVRDYLKLIGDVEELGKRQQEWGLFND